MEKYKVNWIIEATEDLEKIIYYIAYNLKETNTARNLYNKILNDVDVYNKDVYITHIFHSNQNYLNLI